MQNKFEISKKSKFGIKHCTEGVGKTIKNFENNFLDFLSIKAWNNFATEKYTAKDNSIRHRLCKRCEVPSWWRDYNKVKHHRTSVIKKGQEKNNYTKANLGNLCQAFSALYTLEIAFMELIGTKNELAAFADYSRLFCKKNNITTEEIEKMFSY